MSTELEHPYSPSDTPSSEHEEKVSSIESFRRNRMVKKMKKYVVKQLLKGSDIIPASTGRFGSVLESTLSRNSERNAHVVDRVQSELSQSGVQVETLSHIIDAYSTDATLYGFRKSTEPKAPTHEY